MKKIVLLLVEIIQIQMLVDVCTKCRHCLFKAEGKAWMILWKLLAVLLILCIRLLKWQFMSFHFFDVIVMKLFFFLIVLLCQHLYNSNWTIKGFCDFAGILYFSFLLLALFNKWSWENSVWSTGILLSFLKKKKKKKKKQLPKFLLALKTIH